MSDTSEMIRHLAREAGTPAGSGRSAGDFAGPLLGATLIAFALALGVILLMFAGSFDPGAVLGSFAFHCKAGAMLVLAGGAFLLVRHHGVPGSSGAVSAALLPGLALPVLAAVIDRSGFPLFGRDTASVPICFFAILAAALPALGVLLWSLRRAVVTRPGLAGAASGLLAGALGAGAYAIACRNDGALFVLVWYGLAIATASIAGAAAGRRYLRW
jgi:hypothetical protein